MVARGRGAGQRYADAAVLRLLLGEALAGYLEVREAELRVVGSGGDLDVDRGDALDPGLVDIVAEADGSDPVRFCLESISCGLNSGGNWFLNS